MKKIIAVGLGLTVLWLLARSCTPSYSGPSQEQPLTVSVSVQMAGRTVHFSPKVVDAGGKTFPYVVLPSGKLASPPKLIVRNMRGEVAHSTKMKYG